MKGQTAQFLEKADSLLREAEIMLGVGLNNAAGRTAYLAGYHAAQAFLFEREDRVFKTHNGVQSEFLRLTQNDTGFDRDARLFLSRTYNLKAIADYETGPVADTTPARAEAALAAARAFVGHVRRSIGGCSRRPEAESS